MFISLSLILINYLMVVRGNGCSTNNLNGMSNKEVESGYYWLDYSGGPISDNCLKLDMNSNAYVGQVYKKGYELLPATIRTTQPYATSNAYDVTYTSNANVKVLCSHFPKLFVWVNSNAENYLSVANKVPSGEEVDIPAFIGRAYENGKAYLGKLGKELVYPVGPQTRYTRGPFEVLTYQKPNYRCTRECFVLTVVD